MSVRCFRTAVETPVPVTLANPACRCLECERERVAQHVVPATRRRNKEPRAVTKDINVLALVKGAERYIFLFDDDNRAEALRTLGRYASNPDLSFTWYDAAVMAQRVRRLRTEHRRTEDFSKLF